MVTKEKKKERIGLTKKRELVQAITKSHIDDGVPMPEACKLHGVEKPYMYYNWKRRITNYEKRNKGRRQSDKVVTTAEVKPNAPVIIRKMPINQVVNIEKAENVLNRLKDLKEQEQKLKEEIKQFFEANF